ncbi:MULTISPECIES: hypothetical protein [unclassified Enterococcus]|uniref:hypothetical protein n=1 Tax=unclassified Enterococcus TaxID=2608891 RepID=UPI003D29A0B7
MRLLKLLCVGALLCSSFSPTIAYMDDNIAFVQTEEPAAAPQTEEIEQTTEANPAETVEEEVPASAEPVPEPPPAEESSAEEEPIVETPVIEEEPVVEEEPEVLPPPIPENLPDADGILQEVIEGPSPRADYFLNARLRGLKRDYAARTYIEGVLRRAFESISSIDLGTNIGATATRSITFPTHSFFDAGGYNSWVAEIAGNTHLPTPWFTHIYYGDHPRYSGIFSMDTPFASMSQLDGNLANSGIQANTSLTRNGHTMTFTVNLERTGTWDSSRPPVRTLFKSMRVALGATVTSYHPTYPHAPIRLGNEQDVFNGNPAGAGEILGTLTINDDIAPTLEANAIPVSVPLGTTIDDIRAMNLGPFLEVKLDGRTLIPNEYNVSIVRDTLDTNVVGQASTRPRIRVSHPSAAPVELDLPIEVEWSDSVVFGGAIGVSQSVAAFTLHHGNNPKITSAIGVGPTVGSVHTSYRGVPYYRFNWFDMSAGSDLLLTNNAGDQSIEVRGEEQRSVVSRWNTRSVNYGDVVRTWVVLSEMNALRVRENDQFIHHGGEVYYEITPSGYRPLSINRVVTTEHEIEMNTPEAELQNRVAEFIDISNLPNMRVVRFERLPDTSSTGRKEGIIRVAETLSTGRQVEYDYTVSFNITASLNVRAETIPVVLGTTMDDIRNMDLSPFLDVTLGGTTLAPDQYELSFISEASNAITVGELNIKPRIRVSHPSAAPVELDLPIIVEWGNSVVFGGREELTESTSAAFTLHHGTSPRITAAFGNRGSSEIINRNFWGEYYNFSLFSMTGHTSRNLSSSQRDHSASATGQELRSVVLERWPNRTVAYGDVVRTWVAVPTMNVLRVNDQFVNHGGEVYYEITPSGYRPLNINRAITKEQNVMLNTSSEELRNRINEFIDVSHLPNVRVVGFSRLPWTTSPGPLEAEIRVEETLSTGRIVQYDYTVTINVLAPLNVSVENIPVLLGTPTAEVEAMDFNPYLEVTMGDQILTSDQYDVTFIRNNFFNTAIAGTPQNRPRIRVSYTGEGIPPVEVELPIVVEWGDSIVFGGDNDLNTQTVAAFTIHHGAQPRITNAFGNGAANTMIHRSYQGVPYYRLNWFDMGNSLNTTLSNNAGNFSITVQGDSFRSVANIWGTRSVNYGDVIRTWVAEADKNVLRVNDQFVNHGGEVYYEVTPSGYRPLSINRAVTTEHEIEMNTSEAELQNRVAEFIDISNLPNMRVVDFAELPDVTRPGKSPGVIRVAETLASGKEAMYEYTVDFDVTSNASLIDVNLPKEMVFGSTDLYEGKVVSPVYTIENNSEREVRVNIHKVDVTANDNQLALLDSTANEPTGTSNAVRLVMETGATTVGLHENTSNQLLANLLPSRSAQFTIGGNYFGEYGEAIRLGLDIHYRFEILP